MKTIAIASACVVTAMQSADAFELCSGPNRAERKVTCLVDGDTGWEAGVKWRLKGADTPEYKPFAECEDEVEYAKSATYRMLELMRGGYSVQWLGEKDESGTRELVHIRLTDGRDAGEVLVKEGFASKWPHRTRFWCNSLLP
ncbi:thermonuclease family protein [Ochrobactrum sp. 3-3]|uniref:thermonuclease family protein n=1 Tax=Ochrobactrum sp. 3-3 TaxID=1830124 RepID=UPI000DF0080C|nr:thermonuclease family protein [Ochrobactrum sp. 3-3]